MYGGDAEKMTERSAEYAKIGRRLIRTLPEFEDIRDQKVRIAYLVSDEEKKKGKTKLVCADCTQVNSRYEWCCKYDFMITVYEPNVEYFTDHQKEILIRHELHHIGIDYDGVEPSFFIVPHDVEEFWDIIDRYGLEWSKNGQ